MTLLVEGPKRYKEFVLERIRCTLPECENVEDMPFEYLKYMNIYFGILRPVFISEFCFSLPHYNRATTKKIRFYLLPVPLGQICFVLVLISPNRKARNRYLKMVMARTVIGF